jgi:hypothetical protein
MTPAQTADTLTELDNPPKIIYITFSRNEVPLQPDHPYILKPFSIEEIAKKIKEVLKIK